MNNRFWVVFADETTMRCTYRHNSREAAIQEAIRLANQHPGKAFFVAAVTGRAQVNAVNWTELKDTYGN